MKPNISMFAAAVLISLSLLAGLFLPTQNVYAQSPAQDTGTSHSRLERILARERGLLENLQTRLENTPNINARLEEGIARAQSAGYDTAALESALASYEQGVTEAQTAAESAATLLAAPAGFDASGQVTDASAARTSLREAGSDMRDALRTLRAARLTLRAAVADWRNEHPGVLDDLAIEE